MSSPAAVGAEIRRPTTLAEARDAVRAGGTLLFSGGGTKLDWGAPVRGVDATVATGGLNRLLVHDAADATARVQAGLPLAELQDALAQHGQWLAVDPGGGAQATVGGIFATDDAGPSRLAFGTLRDLVIGVTIVLSDGAVARAGGAVIKNVAGYDLTRLLCGSFGTLGLVAELSLRLHPLAQRAGTVHVACEPDGAVHVAGELRRAGLEPVAVDYAEGGLWIRLAGRADALASRLADARRIAGASAELEADDAAIWRRMAADLHGVPGETVLRVGSLPRHLPRVHAAAAGAATETGGGVAASVSSHVLVGAHTVRLRGGDGAAHGRFVDALRRRVRRLQPIPGHVVVRRRAPGLPDVVDPWGAPGPAIGLARAVKTALDPEGRLAPGRLFARTEGSGS